MRKKRVKVLRAIALRGYAQLEKKVKNRRTFKSYFRLFKKYFQEGRISLKGEHEQARA